jgi:hypothetical protein
MSEFPSAAFADDQAFVAWIEKWEHVVVPGVYTETIRSLYEAESGVGLARRIPCPVITSTQFTRPRLAANVDEGKLHVVFNAGQSSSDIFHAARALTATTWPTATQVHTHTLGSLGSYYPALAVGPGGETVHVTWEERHSPAVRAVMYMSGTVGGGDVDWSSPITLSKGITISIYPVIAADSGGNLHVAWGEEVKVDTETHKHVRYTRYNAPGHSWSDPQRINLEFMKINQLKPTDLIPSLALWEEDGVTVCVAWHAFQEGMQAEEIVLSCSEDGGQSWETPQNVSRSPLETELSISPAIAFDDLGMLHAAWQEHVSDDVVFDYEIYYAHTMPSSVCLPLVMKDY